MAYEYITNLSEAVERKHVRYNNRYGMAIAGDLYQKKELDESRQYPAIIVGAPYGGTKEQGPAVYANQLAQMGFVVLTFDQVFMGESAGEPRNVSSPDLFAESFSAAVDYLGVKVPYVNREKIGVIGICGSAGFALSAAAVDPRIKAVVTTSMYDITNVRDMMNLTAEQLADMKEQLANQRWVDFAQGYPEYVPSFPEVPYPDVASLPETDPITNEWQRFYAVPRGFHPNARGNFTTTSNLAMLQFEALRYVKEISPRPILFVYGDRAHSRSFSEVAYEKAAEPREKYIVEDCEHIDLYDRVDKIPFEKIAEFMKENL
ncbi:alpha/beta hydrolase [Enterococcus asini]|uniref:alpha/beta hydrolase n=1 Tax=Enterococcus asini TaxID=57732 RepID=UPI001E2857BA|nr:alpha/beta hydrolase [Enterococcus asini]MCD5028128.1 alpha/beta hydrolase [Enterococcus asini]MDT2783832.1 alpha/beta hydrolase [Enterococcus asini]